MHEFYQTYNEDDFLNDDFFVDSMLSPTSESEFFWNTFTSENEINIDEFLLAYMTLKNLHENKAAVPEELLDTLWNRINASNQKKNSKRLMRLFSIACCSIVIIVLLIMLVFKMGNGNRPAMPINDFPYSEIMIHKENPANKIQIVSDDKTLDIEGVQAKVEYDTAGNLKVNKQSIAEENQAKYNQLKVPYGKRAFLKLCDGTLLWINTGTTVVYPTLFTHDKREIYVDGEVYAEVFHDPQHPFIINTEKLNVQVLGTTLNITAYKEDKRIDVMLVSGLANVKPKNGKPTVMSPNQLFSCTDGTSILKEVNAEDYISWHDGNYIFHNETIENILLRLSKYYNVTMILPANPSGISCSGRLELIDDLTYLLNGLSDITNMSFAVNDREYRIKFN